MAKRRKSVKPLNKHLPEDQKEVRIGKSGIPTQGELETIVWRFSIVDLDGEWGLRTLASGSWREEVLPKLQNFESMTWEEIAKAAGGKGKGKGNNNHFVEVEKLNKKAKKRLAEIEQDDVSQLFSLRLDSTKRIYGIRDRRALKLLWYDPHHGNNNKAVCPHKEK